MYNANVTRTSSDGATSLARMTGRLLLSVGRPYENDMDLFVDGLPPSFSNKQLADLFAGFGTVLRADVAKNKQGTSLQFGFVTMGTSREAYNAMAHLHKSTVDGHLLLVMFAENQWSACRSQSSVQDTPAP